MKKWFHKIGIPSAFLSVELNGFSSQGWKIYEVWKSSYDSYEITAYKEINKNDQKRTNNDN